MNRFTATFAACTFIVATWATGEIAMAETIQLKLRSIGSDATAARRPIRVFKDETWELEQTAVIVCDVWDYHHCLNAVRRLEEFAPRLDQFLKSARTRGAVVIHAPSDCMPAYVKHPARQRAMQVAQAASLPADIEYWCSRRPTEARYPIDQSDGGEDDDPAEHAAWAKKLKELGRNPGMPWKKQSDLITIDSGRDYITDRGDEVWNILEQHGVKNVILTGVHCNMCVLGRPFGLRQMVRNNKHVVLVRDLTDSMYSPKSWPYVDHFSGHDLVLDHVEKNICPTITSDQFLGGERFRWQADRRELPKSDTLILPPHIPVDPSKRWTTLDTHGNEVQQMLRDYQGPVWYRGALRVPEKWLENGGVSIGLPDDVKFQVWLNGKELQPVLSPSNAPQVVRYTLPPAQINVNDYNLLVVKTAQASKLPAYGFRVNVIVGSRTWEIENIWQVRLGDGPDFSNIPLPAKFGIGPDAVLRLRDMRNAF